MKLTESYLRNLIKQAINEMNDPKTPYKKMIDSAANGDSVMAGKFGSYLQTLLDQKPEKSDEEIESLLKKKITVYKQQP